MLELMFFWLIFKSGFNFRVFYLGGILTGVLIVCGYVNLNSWMVYVRLGDNLGLLGGGFVTKCSGCYSFFFYFVL